MMKRSEGGDEGGRYVPESSEVPKTNFFFLESVVYFSKYDVNQRTRDSQSQDKKNNLES